MANFPLPSQLALQYLQILQSIKPSINISDINSDFVIRGQVFAAFASGLYGDQAQVDANTYITSASPESLILHGQDLGIPQLQATQSSSTGIQITGTDGVVISLGEITFTYLPTGVSYTNITGGTITGGVLTLSIQSTTSGSITNVESTATLMIAAPPTGVNNTASVNISIAGGSDIESTDSYRARLLNRLQQPPSGGNLNDLRNMAYAADSSVRSVIVYPFILGLGTVGIYIVTGTTDINNAVTNGSSIVRVPSQSVIDNVQAYYDLNAPITMCISVYAPTEIDFNSTVYVDLASGISLSTIPSDPVNNPLGLTVQQLVIREFGRALYLIPIGGHSLGSLSPPGYVVASYIEESIAKWLSSEIDITTGLTIGIIPVLADIRVPELNPPNTNYAIDANQIVAPNTISVVLGT